MTLNFVLRLNFLKRVISNISKQFFWREVSANLIKIIFLKNINLIIKRLQSNNHPFKLLLNYQLFCTISYIFILFSTLLLANFNPSYLSLSDCFSKPQLIIVLTNLPKYNALHNFLTNPLVILFRLRTTIRTIKQFLSSTQPIFWVQINWNTFCNLLVQNKKTFYLRSPKRS